MIRQKSLVLLVLAALAVNVGHMTWRETFAEEDYAIRRGGIVDVQRALDGYTKHKEGASELEKQASGAEARLEFAQTEFKRMSERYQKERPGLTEDERAQRESELREKRLAIDSQAKQAAAQLERGKTMLKREIIDDLLAAVEQIGQEQNFDLICESDPEARTGVLFHASRIDITDRVIARLNAGG